jgi:hypothetical protein
MRIIGFILALSFLAAPGSVYGQDKSTQPNIILIF